MYQIWESQSAAGWALEIPVRAPGLPANIWIHIAGNSTDWSGFPPIQSTDGDTDWHMGPLYASVSVEAGDIVLAAIASVGLAGIRREKEDIFNTNEWGVAVDSLAATDPPSTTFFGQLGTLGEAWPGGLSITADLLVLRSSIIPAVPPLYGTSPPTHRPSIKKIPLSAAGDEDTIGGMFTRLRPQSAASAVKRAAIQIAYPSMQAMTARGRPAPKRKRPRAR